jgi:hypothetical protein
MNARIFFTALALALFSLPSAYPQAGPSNTMRWAEGAPNATSDMKDNNKIEGLKTDDIHIYASIAELKETEYNRVWVQITNHSKAPIDFDPLTAILINEKDKTVRAEIPDKAAKSIQKMGEAKSQELASAHCVLMSQQNCQPTNAQMQVSKQVAALSAQQAQWVRDNAVSKQTLAPGNEAQGAIVFRKDKKAADYILRVTVGTQVFEFPLRAENKAPNYD